MGVSVWPTVLRLSKRTVRVVVFFTLFFATSIGNFSPILAAALSEATSSASTPSIPKPLDLPFKDDYAVTRTFGEKLQGELAQNLKEVEGASGHNGIDFAMPEGTEILAVDEGEVVSAGEGDYGITVVLQHSWGESVYGHLSKVISDKWAVDSGKQTVTKGQVIGLSGSTGLATGPHLHLGIKNSKGKWVDPVPYLGLDSSVIASEAKQSNGEIATSSSTPRNDILGEATSSAKISFEDVSGDDSFLYNYKFNLANGTSAHFGHKYDPRLGYAIADNEYNYKLRFFLENNLAIEQFNNVPLVDGNQIDFPIRVGGVSAMLRYTVEADRVKEEIILDSRPEQLTGDTSTELSASNLQLTFEVQNVDLEVNQQDGEYIFASNDGSVLWRVTAPTVVDANGKSGEITGVLSSVIARSEATKQSDSETEIATSLDSLGTRNDNSLYTLTLTNDFLESASYPLTIDPTVILSGGFTETKGGDNLKTNTGAQIRESVMRQHPNAIEILDKRTENSKTFLVKTNPDGSKTYHWGGSVGEIHYKDNPDDSSEQWKEIDTQVEKATDEQKQQNGGYDFFNTTNNFKSYFKKESMACNTVRYEYNGSFITFALEDNELGKLNQVEGYAKDNQFIYPNAYDNIDVRYSIGTRVLLEEFVLHQPKDIAKISQRVHFEDAYYQEQEDGSVIFYFNQTNEPIWSFPKPKMYEVNERKDENGFPSRFENFGLHYEITKEGNDYIVTKVLDQEGKDWLLSSERIYPLVIDTTVDKQVAAAGTNDGRRNPYALATGNTTEYVGVWTGDYNNLFHRWTGVTIAGTIDVSYIQLYAHGNPQGSALLKVYGVDEDNPDAPTTAAQFDADPLTNAGVDWDGGWTKDVWAQSQSLNTIFQELVNTFTISNEAVMVQVRNDGATGSNYNDVRMYDYSGNLHGAKLHIEYTANTASNNPTSPTQLKNDASTEISNGGYTNETNVKLKASATDADTTETLTLFFEAVTNSSSFISPATPTTVTSCTSGTAFTDCTNKIWYVTSDSGNYSSTPYTGTVNVTGLSDGTGYKWQAKACDDDSACSSWAVFNATTPNFTVDTTAPSTVSNLASSSHTTSTWNTDTAIDVSWTAATDTGGSGIAGYSYIFDTTSNTTPDTSSDGSGTSVTSSAQSDGNSISSM